MFNVVYYVLFSAVNMFALQLPWENIVDNNVHYCALSTNTLCG